MKNFYVLLLTFCLCFMIVGCKKNDPAGPTVYVVGQDGNRNAYWKDGVETLLNEPFYASDGLIAGDDVYFAGTLGFTPKYVKNNSMGDLPLSVNATSGQALSTFVVGTDLYVGGFQVINNKDVPVIWKNGIIQILPSSDGIVWAIFVSGTDVYAAGRDGFDLVYWKNGAKVLLQSGDSSHSGTVNAIFVSGSDVYIAGYFSSQMKYWKNGAATNLTASAGFTVASENSITVSGNDIYVGGSQANGNQVIPTYWKNGVPVILGADAAVTNMFMSGDDVYACGYTLILSQQNLNKPVYWKNGQSVLLPHTQDRSNTFYITVK